MCICIATKTIKAAVQLIVSCAVWVKDVSIRDRKGEDKEDLGKSYVGRGRDGHDEPEA